MTATALRGWERVAARALRAKVTRSNRAGCARMRSRKDAYLGKNVPRFRTRRPTIRPRNDGPSSNGYSPPDLGFIPVKLRTLAVSRDHKMASKERRTRRTDPPKGRSR